MIGAVTTGVAVSVVPVVAEETDVMNDEAILTTLAESERFAILKAESPDGETTYHIEMEQVTIHLLPDEWAEFQALLQEAAERA